MPTNTKESGFESLIIDWLVTQNGYDLGTNDGYNREYAIDEPRLFGFLIAGLEAQFPYVSVSKSPPYT